MLGKILGGRYQIMRHLGGGGFGQTYLAEDFHLPGNPTCVVKQLKPRMTSTEALQAASRLFDTEAQVLYTLGSHDQIPRLFAHFEDNQDFYLVQEFIEGDVLNQELTGQKYFSEAEVMSLLQEVLTVLAFVHQQQVVHRDIKPSNLIRRKRDRRIILIDFGAVKQIGVQSSGDTHEASVTVAVGSSGYMPNEQLAGKPRFSSDIYAVGMLAIQCLTGIYPRKLKEDPKTSEVIWRDRVQVSPELADLIDTMVRYDFRQRYPSAKEALAALNVLSHTTSVSALLSQRNLVSFDGHLAWLERGDELFQLQRYKEAITAYDRVIQAKPDDYLAWFKRGIALENRKQYEEAIASYDQVVQLQPEDYLAWYKRGSVCEQLQQTEAALQSYEQVVQLQPDHYWAWHDRGKVLEQLKQFEEAVNSYDRAVQLKPDFQLAVESRKRVLSQLRRVDTLYHLQHYDEAVAACDRTIQQNPNDSIAWFMRGMALENLHCYEQAVAAYERVVAIQPDDHVAWFKRSNLLEKLHRYEDAIASYAKVVQIQPDNYWAWNDRARLLENLGRCEESLTAYDRAMQLKSDLQSAVEGRQRVLKQLQQSTMPPVLEEPDETIVAQNLAEEITDHFQLSKRVTAVADDRYMAKVAPAHPAAADPVDCDADTAINLPLQDEETMVNLPNQAEQKTVIDPPKLRKEVTEPTFAIAQPDPNTSLTDYSRWFQKGRALERLQRYVDAIAAYDHAGRIHANDPDLWRLRGNVLYTLKRYAEAIASYNRALRLQPDNADICSCLASCLTRLRRYQDALTWFDRAIQIKPDSHAAWYWRGRVLCELQHYAEALHSFDRALVIKADFQPAISDRQRLQSQFKAVPKPATRY